MPKPPKGLSAGQTSALALGLWAGLMALPAHADFDSCLAGIRAQAAAAGVSGRAFEAATSGISYDDKVIELSQAQPEFKTPIWTTWPPSWTTSAWRTAAPPCASMPTLWPAPRPATASTATHHRGGVGRGIELRQEPRQDAAGSVARHPLLLGQPPPRLLPRRVDRHPQDHRPGRHRARPSHRLLGRSLRPDPVHAHHLPAPRRGWRRGWPPRRGRFGGRCRRLDREFPPRRQVAARPGLGLRGEAALKLQRVRRRPPQQEAGLPLGRPRRDARGWPSAVGRRPGRHHRAGGGGWPRLPRDQETSTRSIRTTRRNPTASPSPSCPTGCAASRGSRRHGRPTIRPCPAPSGAISRCA